MVAKIPHPEYPEPTREQREVAALEKLIRRNWGAWVELGVVAAMPAWELMRFRGCAR